MYELLDGSSVSASGVDSSSWSSLVRISSGTNVIRFESNLSGALENDIHAQWKVAAEASYKQARIVAAHNKSTIKDVNPEDLQKLIDSEDVPQTIFSYMDGDHEVSTVAAGHITDLDRFAEILDNLIIKSSRSGVSLRVRKNRDLAIQLDAATTSDQDIAVVLLPGHDVRLGLPRKKGKVVRGGHMWKQSEGGGMSVVISNETAVVQVSQLGISAEAFQAKAEALVVNHDTAG